MQMNCDLYNVANLLRALAVKQIVDAKAIRYKIFIVRMVS